MLINFFKQKLHSFFFHCFLRYRPIFFTPFFITKIFSTVIFFYYIERSIQYLLLLFLNLLEVDMQTKFKPIIWHSTYELTFFYNNIKHKETIKNCFWLFFELELIRILKEIVNQSYWVRNLVFHVQTISGCNRVVRSVVSCEIETINISNNAFSRTTTLVLLQVTDRFKAP